MSWPGYHTPTGALGFQRVTGPHPEAGAAASWYNQPAHRPEVSAGATFRARSEPLRPDPAMAPSRWLPFGLLAAVLASTTWVAAQPPRKEEEEEPKEKVARPVVPVPVAEPGKKDAPPASAIDPDVGTMAEEAKKAKTAAARDLFRGLALPYDRLDSTFAGAPPLRIELWPTRDLPEEEFEVRVLTPNLKESFPKKLATGSGFTLTPFELVVVEQV